MALMSFREENQVKWVGIRPGHDGTQVTLRDSAANTTTTIYTVPAGKVFYLTHWRLNVHDSAAGNFGALNVLDDGPVLQYRIDEVTMQAVGEYGNAAGLFYPIEIPAGWIVQVQSNNAAITVTAFIHGWVE